MKISNYYLKKEKDYNYYNDNTNKIKTGKINKNVEPNEMFKEGELEINYINIINKEFGIKNIGNTCYRKNSNFTYSEITVKKFFI